MKKMILFSLVSVALLSLTGCQRPEPTVPGGVNLAVEHADHAEKAAKVNDGFYIDSEYGQNYH
jgi:hypothetical protein